jgi:glucose/mannose-6-phosphate isomerase
MSQEIDRFVDNLTKSAKTRRRMSMDFNRVCICGMGGSAMSGDIIADALLVVWDVPIHIIRSTSLPNWVDEQTLTILSSYSGDTRETLMMYDQAKAKGCKIIAVTTGGQLKKKCTKDSNKLIIIPERMQPRSSIGYTVGYIANIIQTSGGPPIADDILKFTPSLRNYRESIWMRNAESQARHIAEKICGTVPVIYAAGALSSIAVRWKNQINENSKMIAFNGAITEMNHNEIVGWSESTQRSKCIPVLLCSKHTLDKMMDESLNIMRSSGIDPVIVAIDGETELETGLKLIMLGDYVSLFLASMNGVDPMDIGPIKTFKRKLAALLSRKKNVSDSE